jgi:hypothetical protein
MRVSTSRPYGKPSFVNACDKAFECYRVVDATDAQRRMYMGILDELLGGGQRQKDYKDFVDRYEQGSPSEGYSDQEVLERYGEVSHAVPPDQYAQAAREARGKLSPEERAEFLKMLQERAAARGVTLPREVAPDPTDLGKVRSPVSFGIFSVVATLSVAATPNLRSKRQGRTPLSIY